MKQYEIQGVKRFSNIYYELKTRNLNRRIAKWSPVIIILLLGFTMWFCQMVVATASVPMSITTNVYHVK